MALDERITYAFVGAIFGALVGIACWWLYGVAHSLNYDGPEMDPVLRHWLICGASAFAAIGFVLRERVGDIVGDVLGAIFHFEVNHAPSQSMGAVATIALLIIIIAAIWFTVPS